MAAKPARLRRSVDFPDPEGPIRAQISPRATLSDTWSSARTAPKLALMSWADTMVSAKGVAGVTKGLKTSIPKRRKQDSPALGKRRA